MARRNSRSRSSSSLGKMRRASTSSKKSSGQSSSNAPTPLQTNDAPPQREPQPQPQTKRINMPRGNLWILSTGYVPDGIVMGDFELVIAARVIELLQHMGEAELFVKIRKIAREEFDRRFCVIGR